MEQYISDLFRGLLVTDILQACVVTIGVFVTVATYRRNSKLQRAEWIYRLYAQFYENDRFKPIRRLLDYESKNNIERLKADIEAERDSDLHESLVDYLNFFEFICIQLNDGNLHRREVYGMFEYYIRRINDYPFLTAYVANYGYENLTAELARLEPT